MKDFKKFSVSVFMCAVSIWLGSGCSESKSSLSANQRYVVTQESTLNLRESPVNGKVIDRFLFIFLEYGIDASGFSIHESQGGELKQILMGGVEAC